VLANEWNSQELEEWGLDLPIFMDDETQGKEEKKELKPYKKTHVLLSFHPDLIFQIQEKLDEIIKIEGIEYEQASN